MTSTLRKTLLIALGMVAFVPTTMATDISKALRDNSDVNTESENYFEIGAGVYAGKGPSITSTDDDFGGASILINGSYSYKGFFIDAFSERSNYLELGYNAYDTENWSFDVLLSPVFAGARNDNKPRFEGLDDRNPSAMLGARMTGSFDGNIVQFSLSHDISGNSKGTTATALMGRNWQHRNWNFHSLVGLHFADADHTNFYVGITEAEASATQFSEFRPGASVTFTAEAGVTYPISEDWVFRATSRFGAKADDNADSPLLLNNRSNGVSISSSISYVF